MHSTLPPSSLAPGGPSMGLPGADTFRSFGTFLRGGLADEDSRVLSESLGQLALNAEAVVAALRLSRKRGAVAPLLMDLLTVLRDHRALVVNLGLAWRGLYEYAAYLQALNNYRVLVGQWLLHAGPRDGELAVTAEEFGLVAWRTMGDGMLLLEMYEQWLRREEDASHLAQLEEPQLERVRQWWQRLRR